MNAPPSAERRPIVRSHHGDDFVDDYEWLRDKEDPATLAYLEAENAYTDAATAHLEPLRQQIFDEIKARTLETDLSVPVRRGKWWYYARTVEGQQYAIRCRCPIDDADDWNPPLLEADAEIAGEEVLLDSNAEAEGHEFFSLGAFSISDDENLLAWSVDTQGDERYTIRVKDLRTGEVLPDEIPATSGGATWSAGGTHLFYTTVDEAWRPHRVWRHRLGTTAEDVMVLEEPDERYFIGVGRTQSERFLVIGLSSKVTSEVRVLEADDPEGEFRVVLPRRDGVEYSLEHAVIRDEDFFLVLHNDGALNFELAAVRVDDPSVRTVVIPGSESTRLEDVDVFAKQLVVSYRRDALSRIGIIPLGSDGLGELTEIDFGEELFTSGVGANAEWDQPLIRVGVGSFITPASIYDYVVETGELILRKQAPVLGGYDPNEYEQHRSWAVADDGVRVPVSVVCRKDTPRDGTAPALIYGYGAYEASMDPGFSVMRLSLLDRGFVFAIAHVRGGGELGRHWYDDGKMLHKRNTFTDFVAERAAPRQRGLDVRRPPDRRGRQRRWPADGRRRQPGARRFRRHRRERAVRRRAHHDPRPEPAAHGHRVGRVGQPAGGSRRLRLHEVLHALRERGRPSIPGHSGGHEPARHPSHVRRAGQVGRPAASDGHRRGPDPAQDRDARGARRRERPLRVVEGTGLGARLDHR